MMNTELPLGIAEEQIDFGTDKLTMIDNRLPYQHLFFDKSILYADVNTAFYQMQRNSDFLIALVRQKLAQTADEA